MSEHTNKRVLKHFSSFYELVELLILPGHSLFHPLCAGDFWFLVSTSSQGQISSRFFCSDLPARLLVHEVPSSLAPTWLPSTWWWWQTSHHSAWLSWAPLLHGCLLSFHGLHIYCGPSGLSISWGEEAWFVYVHPIQVGLSFVWGRKEEGQRMEGWWRREIIYFLSWFNVFRYRAFPLSAI